MKVLTLTQPWATLVAIGAKKIETRSWWTSHRGPLAIHAAKGFPAWARGLIYQEPFASTLAQAGIFTESALPLGVIVATCNLIGTGLITPARSYIKVKPQPHYNCVGVPPEEPELSFGDYTPGRYAWILTDIQPLPEPIPARGMQGLWEFDL